MATKTVLDMVQNILSSMDGDNVNSISDTIESQQVADVIKEVYEDMVIEYDLPGNQTLFQLEAGTGALPTHMTLPSNIVRTQWIKYNSLNAPSDPVNYVTMRYLSQEEFIDLVSLRDSTDASVASITDPSGIILLIRTDKNPQYYTSFNDLTIVFDSYLSTVDNPLVKAKTSCYGSKENTLTLTDGAIPALPPQLFPLLQTEVKARCFAYFKQQANPKVERNARRQRLMQQTRKHRATNGSLNTINYGRKR